MVAKNSLVGSIWLRQYFGLSSYPLTHHSYIGSGPKTEILPNGHIQQTFGPGYAPSLNTPLSHWEFALKYDHVDLPFYKAVLSRIDEAYIKTYIHNAPTSKYTRKTGFLYEFLLGKDLGITTSTGNYVDLIDSNRYVTGNIQKNNKWRVNNNLLGNAAFCPIIRRSETLDNLLSWNLLKEIESLREKYSAETFVRAVNYLYRKETKSSYEIEHERPSPQRVDRFVSLLQQAGQVPSSIFLEEQSLTSWQNSIVDSRFAATGFRDFQNYVGESMPNFIEKIHYICPPPQLVGSLMKGLSDLASETKGLSSLVRASMIAFGFVFIHPFEDGNGRLHRFLIHDVLIRDLVVPGDIILPVSAHILNHMREYDAALEAYSVPLVKMADYLLDSKGEITIKNADEIEAYYRYPDLTQQTLYLTQTIRSTVLEELPMELYFIQHYDELKKEIQDIVDMPDKDINLMILFLYQNKGNLSKGKRKSFEKLTDDEIAKMEDSFKAIFLNF
jgi:hypothetical protein